jgi:CheY-like chemotaxis protein
MKIKLKSILLIDDDKITNYLHEKLIKNSGISKKILIARNGKEALNHIASCGDAQELPELILLDLNMPVLGGFEFLEQFQKLGNLIKHKIKVVILSTSIHPKDKERLNNFKVELVNKPLTEEKLLSMWEKNFKKKSAEKFTGKIRVDKESSFLSQ